MKLYRKTPGGNYTGRFTPKVTAISQSRPIYPYILAVALAILTLFTIIALNGHKLTNTRATGSTSCADNRSAYTGSTDTLPSGVSLCNIDGNTGAGTGYFSSLVASKSLNSASDWLDQHFLVGGWELQPLNATEVSYDRAMDNNIYWNPAGDPTDTADCGGSPCRTSFEVIRNGGMHDISQDYYDSSNDGGNSALDSGSETVGFQGGDENDLNDGAGSDTWNMNGTWPNNCTPAENASPAGACGYTQSAFYYNGTNTNINPSGATPGYPTSGSNARIVNQGFGKGVLFFETTSQAAQFLNYSDILSADSYWMTDDGMYEDTSVSCNVLPLSPIYTTSLYNSECDNGNGSGLTVAQTELPANYSYNINYLEQLQATNGASKPTAADIETGCPFSDGGCATVPEFTASAWQAIIAGARGIIWFQHNFGGNCEDDNTFYDGYNSSSGNYNCVINNEAMPVANPSNSCSVSSVSSETLHDLVNGVTCFNEEVTNLNSVLLDPFAQSYVSTTADVSTMAKYDPSSNEFYIFAGSGQLADPPSANQSATFTVAGGCTTVNVIYTTETGPESGTINCSNGQFTDTFPDQNSDHIYEIANTADESGSSAPVNSALPSTSGTTTVGDTLTTTNGTWTNSPTGYTYQWQDCTGVSGNAGTGCTNITTNGTSSSYVLTSSDSGKYIDVIVTASNGTGSTNATSDATSQVTPQAPVNTSVPSISGTTKVGSMLTTTNGSWTNSPTGYSYHWQDCTGVSGNSGTGCSNITTNGTSSSYTLTSGDNGKYIDVIVTASNTGGSTSATSNATAQITPPAPVNTALPVISGTDIEGDTLSTTNGSWSNSPSSYTYQWQDCTGVSGSTGTGCSNVTSSGTSSIYVLTSNDVGKYLNVVVTASNTGGSTSATSSVSNEIAGSVCSDPSTPTGVTESSSTYTSITLSWSASTADSDCTVAGYNVYRNGTKVGSVTTNLSSPSYTDSGLSVNTGYGYSIQAYDDQNNKSSESSSVNLSTVSDNEPPSAPANLSVTLDGPSSVDLSWSASSENVNLGGITISNYKIYRCSGASCSVSTTGSPLSTTSNGTTLSFNDNSVDNSTATSYTYQVVSTDLYNSSSASSSVSITTLPCTTSDSGTDCSNPNGSNLNTTNSIITSNETLTNDGILCNTTVSSEGILKGSGSIGTAGNNCDLTVNTDGTVSPGHSPGCITVNGDYSQSGIYTSELQSPGQTACTDYDQIIVTGNVTLDGNLNLDLLNSFSPSVGQTFEILNNEGSNPVNGTFTNLPEGSVFQVANTKFQISYEGGDGNDVVLTAVNPSTSITAKLPSVTTSQVPGTPDTGQGLSQASVVLPLIATLASAASLTAYMVYRKSHTALNK